MLPFKEMAALNKDIHEPARLAILNALNACTMAEFLFLQELTGLTKGNLSCHLSRLEKSNYILINKQFVRKKIPHTTIQITHEGRSALTQYWKNIDQIRNEIKKWEEKTTP